MAKALLKILQLAGGSLLAAALLNGCAFPTQYASLSYVPQTGVSQIAGAGAVGVKVEVNDLRTTQKDRVGSIPGMFNSEAGLILTTDNVPGLVKSAIETELASRGFNLGGSNVLVVAELSIFYHQYNDMVATGTGNVTMSVQVKRADGNAIYAKLVAGEYIAQGLSAASGYDAQTTLDLALRDATAKLFSDQAFIDALFKAARP